jgi:hypothetical protein
MKNREYYFTIETIPHKTQEYETVGNYQHRVYKDETDVYISVSKMSDWRYSFLVSVHELIEYGIVMHQRIPLSKITAFDIQFEKKRKKGNTDEPGDSPACPYKFAHSFATKVEKLLAVILGVNWAKYEREVNSL